MMEVGENNPTTDFTDNTDERTMGCCLSVPSVKSVVVRFHLHLDTFVCDLVQVKFTEADHVGQENVLRRSAIEDFGVAGAAESA